MLNRHRYLVVLITCCAARAAAVPGRGQCWGAAGRVAQAFLNVVTTSASPSVAARSMVPGRPLHLAQRSDVHPETPTKVYSRRPPRGPAFSWAPDRKRALVRGSLVLGPACQQGRYFVAVTGSRNPPELRDFVAATAG